MPVIIGMSPLQLRGVSLLAIRALCRTHRCQHPPAPRGALTTPEPEQIQARSDVGPGARGALEPTRRQREAAPRPPSSRSARVRQVAPSGSTWPGVVERRRRAIERVSTRVSSRAEFEPFIHARVDSETMGRRASGVPCADDRHLNHLDSSP